MPSNTAPEAEHGFAQYVRILGRGPGRSRALTRDEARDALGLVLAGAADPVQIGAFLMLLRYRGEDPDEIAGLVEAARLDVGHGLGVTVDLDWPSYGAGKTRGVPWFLLAALTLAGAGHRILMHGSNAFSSGVPVADALAALGLAPARNRDEAGEHLARARFAYLPLTVLSPGLDHLLGLRRLLGLRSPINTVARLLDPGNALASIDGVFHPPYIELHLAAAERLNRLRLLVIKGGGGEAERNPAKPAIAHLTSRTAGRAALTLPALPSGEMADSADFAEIWRRGAAPGPVLATIALGLLAIGVTSSPEQADADSIRLWRDRHGIG